MNLKDEPFLVEIVKNSLCYVAADARIESRRAFPKPRSQVAMEYVLPDGVSSARGHPRDPRDPAYAPSPPRPMALCHDSHIHVCFLARRCCACASGGCSRYLSSAVVCVLKRVHMFSVIEAKQQAAAAAVAAGQGPPAAVLLVNNERFMVPEALFRPQDVGVPQAGVATAAAEALRGVHGALRPLLSRNVLLAGGTAACPGFAARLEADLRPQVDDLCDLRVTLPDDPAGAAWRGGSAAAAAGWYHGVMVTKAEYDEYGGGKVRRTAPIG